MALNDIRKESVEHALDEYYRRGRKTMLDKYNSGEARKWYLVDGDRIVDQKLIVRAARAHQNLEEVDFTAHEACRCLKKLGYRVVFLTECNTECG